MSPVLLCHHHHRHHHHPFTFTLASIIDSAFELMLVLIFMLKPEQFDYYPPKLLPHHHPHLIRFLLSHSHPQQDHMVSFLTFHLLLLLEELHQISFHFLLVWLLSSFLEGHHHLHLPPRCHWSHHQGQVLLRLILRIDFIHRYPSWIIYFLNL